MPMTFEEEHERLLAKLDEAYQEWRAIQADPTHLNCSSKGAKSAAEHLLDADTDLWKFKQVYFEARRARKNEIT